jgi:mono/diheme cytochrome c family protein
MPGLGVFLTDEQVLAVSTYVRTNLSNEHTDPITLEEVKKLRKPAKGLFDE